MGLTAPSAGFGALDWGFVLAVLLGVTLLGERLAGRQRSARDFFLGGRRLPWWAVAASIVATEISAVTYVSFPGQVFRAGGNLSYLAIVLLGSACARAFVGFVLVPAYYEREIYSPYDYVAHRLGELGRRVTTGLFTLGGILAQSARVYVTALVLAVILREELAQVERATGLAPLVAAVGAITLVAVAWTWMGGIATVVWTDFLLLGLFLLGIGVTLGTVVASLDGGAGEILRAGREAGKLVVFDTSLDPRRANTVWMALAFSTWGQVGPYGCDQLMVQRLFCCRDAREAKKAILASTAAVLVVLLMGLVGVALFAYYRAHPLDAPAAAYLAEQGERVLPYFVTSAMATPLKGVVVAGVFAAAISSLDSVLAALSQTSLSAWVLPRRRPGAGGPEAEARWAVRAARGLVLGWGIVLGAAAIGIESVAAHYASVLDLALAMAGYTGGALLAAFFLAFLPLRPRPRGLAWSAPLSVMTVFAVVWHAPWAQGVCLGYALVCAAAWLVRRRDAGLGPGLALGCGLALVLALARWGELPGGGVLAWPTYVPIGALVAFGFALLLDPRGAPPSEARAVQQEAALGRRQG